MKRLKTKAEQKIIAEQEYKDKIVTEKAKEYGIEVKIIEGTYCIEGNLRKYLDFMNDPKVAALDLKFGNKV